jgi:hypothetical protein
MTSPVHSFCWACTLVCSASTFPALASPFTTISGNGNTNVFSQVGPWNAPVCEDVSTVSHSVKDLLLGVYGSTACETKMGNSNAIAAAQMQLEADGFVTWIASVGHASAIEGGRAVNSHAFHETILVESTLDRRVRIDLSLQARGLGTVLVNFGRYGDVGGGGTPSPSIVDENIIAYIDNMIFDTVLVTTMPAGRWELFLYSSHDCMTTNPGFEFSEANLMFRVTVVSVGDVDGNGVVDTSDLLAIIGEWGACDSCLEDLDGDGIVGVSDVLQVIEDWG